MKYFSEKALEKKIEAIGGGGKTYSAGVGLDLNDTVFSIKDSVLAEIAKISDWFELKDGNIHVRNNRGFWSDSFISAGGLSSGGGAAAGNATLSNVTTTGATISADGVGSIDVYSKGYLDTALAQAGKVQSVVGQTGAVTAAQIGNALISEGYELTDHTYTNGTGLSLAGGEFSVSTEYQAKIQSGEDAYTDLHNWFERINIGTEPNPVWVIHVKSDMGFYSDSFVSAGGISPGGGASAGNATLVAQTYGGTLSATGIDPINFYSKEKVDQLLATAGTVQTVAGVSPTSGDIPVASLKSALGLGAAAAYGIGSVASGSTGLVTGGSVYSAINEAVSSVMKMQGTTTTPISDGSITNPVVIDGESYTAKKGDVVLYEGKEYLWAGSAWEQLGDEASWALKTTSISAGTGLEGGGTLASNRTISINPTYQTYISNGNTAYGWGNHANAGYLLATTAASTYATITALNGVSERVTTLEGRTNWDTYFGVDENGDIYVKKNGTTARNFYSWGAVSAGGLSSGGGASGIDLAAMWGSLTNSISDAYATTKIAAAHIPDMASTYGYLKSADAVADVALNDDYLRVTKNGMNTDLTIPYASRAGYVDGTNSGNWDANLPGNYQYLWFYGQVGGVSNFPQTLVGSYGSIVNFLSFGSSGSLHAQLAWGINHASINASNGIAWRAKNNLGWDTTWHRLYDDNYHPTADNASTLNGQPGSYYAAASSLSSYLPLSGGTMTGRLTMSNRIDMDDNVIEMGSGMLGAPSLAAPTTLYWYDDSEWRTVWHAGNANNFNANWDAKGLRVGGQDGYHDGYGLEIYYTNDDFIGLGGVSVVQSYGRGAAYGDNFYPLRISGSKIVLTGGNVGINEPNPTLALEVLGAMQAGDATYKVILETRSDGGSLTFWNQSFHKGYIDAANIVMQTYSGGNVGIGTTSPGHKLDVNGDFHTSGNIYIEQSGGIFCGPSGAGWRKIYGCDSDGGTYTRMASYAMLPDNDNNDCWQVRPWNGGYSSAYITVLHGGNAGIGTTTPASKLDVYSSVADTYALQIKHGAVTQLRCAHSGGYGLLLDSTSSSANVFLLRIRSVTELDSTTRTEVLCANADGNVGIGTASPGYALDVAGNAQVRSELYFNSGNAFIANTFRITGSAKTGEIGVFCNDGSSWEKFLVWCSTMDVYGNIDATGTIHSSTGIWSDGYVSAGGLASSSDERLKSGIKDFGYSAEMLMALRPREWDWNAKSYMKGHAAGVVAQELQQVMPYAIVERQYLSVNYDMLHGLEIAGLQDHETRIRQLERENAELKRRLNMN